MQFRTRARSQPRQRRSRQTISVPADQAQQRRTQWRFSSANACWLSCFCWRCPAPFSVGSSYAYITVVYICSIYWSSEWTLRQFCLCRVRTTTAAPPTAAQGLVEPANSDYAVRGSFFTMISNVRSCRRHCISQSNHFAVARCAVRCAQLWQVYHA